IIQNRVRHDYIFTKIIAYSVFHKLRELGIDENQFGEDGAPPADNGGADIMGQFEDLGNAPIDDGAPQEPVMNGFTEPAPTFWDMGGWVSFSLLKEDFPDCWTFGP
uniref:Uncharacterized protein n=1 Tax=Clytia hemisphaerica TaxID=252671 RepID=A0A7M5U2A0_9CNID